MWPFKKNYYFFTFELKEAKVKDNIPKQVLRYINRFVFFKLKKINYFEPFTNKLTKVSTIVLGTPKKSSQATMNRNVVIFLLELYANMDKGIAVSKDFPSKEVKIGKNKITRYKVPKFYFKK